MTDRSMDKIIDHLPLSWLPLPTTQSALSDVAQMYVSKSLFEQEFKDLRYMPWKFNYLDYSQLQQYIDTISSSKVVAKRIELEWIKVHEFFTLKKGEIERRIAACHLLNKEDNHQLPEQVKIVQSDIYRLYHFAKLNYSGFLRLFMRYDQLFESSLTDLLLHRMLTNKTFWDPSTVLFELAHQINCLIPSPSNLVVNIKKETIKKQTIKKYWVHPDNILEIMLYLSSQAVIQSNRPLDLYPAVSEVDLSFPSEAEDEKQDYMTNLDDASKTQITTIHFDTPTFTSYSDRIANKGSKDSMIRMRCFNDSSKDHEAPNSVAIEEKIYGHGISDVDEQLQFYTHKSLGKVPQYVQEPMFSIVSEEQLNCSHIKQRLWLKKNQASSWVQENYSFQNVLSETSSHNCTRENKDKLKDICLQFENKICTKLKSPG
ncbi:hypothetical protein G6F38_001332 [Rhizopus arrhizus]|nr:hypothetical protein G6F38_001332 [Rhizopus arrhizus]